MKESDLAGMTVNKHPFVRGPLSIAFVCCSLLVGCAQQQIVVTGLDATQDDPVTQANVEIDDNSANIRPTYPLESRRNGEQGRVVLKVWLGSEPGLPREVAVFASSGYRRLDKAAFDAVKSWRFDPAKRNGKRIDGCYLVPITFSLPKPAQH
jgi:TonB family protein